VRLGIHPLVFLIGSLLLSVAWLALRPAPPAPGTRYTVASSPRRAAPARERKTIELPPEIMKRYAGSYELDGVDVAIELDAGRLYARAAGTPRYELHAISETSFFTQEIDSDIQFRVDASGRAQSFVARFPTGTIEAQRVR
jgi:hypothetical protein